MNTKLTVALLALTAVLTGCKHKKGGRCTDDSNCKSGLICVRQQCRTFINCDTLKSKYHQCINEIFTVRDPKFKPAKSQLEAGKQNFDNSFYKECKKERGAYDDVPINKCINIADCTKFARCLLELEKFR